MLMDGPKSVQDFAAELAAIVARMKAQVAPLGPSSPDLLNAARTLQAMRRLREEAFGADLFGEPAWDVLLGLFIALEEGRKLSMTSVAVLSRVPAATAMRHIVQLEQAGFVRRADRAGDRRSRAIELTDAGRTAIERVLSFAVGADGGSH